MYTRHDLLNGRIYLLNGRIWAVNGKKPPVIGKILGFQLNYLLHSYFINKYPGIASCTFMPGG
jgi:hypothetical protein